MTEKEKDIEELLTPEEKDDKQFEEIKETAKKYYFDADKKELHTVKEIFEVTTKIEKIWVGEPLGCEILIGHISMKDMADLMAIEDVNLKGLEMLYRILKSADPKTKKEHVYDLPMNVTAAMITAITKAGLGFQGATT